MRKVILMTVINDTWANSLQSYLKNHFNGKHIDFTVDQIGNSAYNVSAEPTKEYRSTETDLTAQLFFWTGYYYAQVASIRNR